MVLEGLVPLSPPYPPSGILDLSIDVFQNFEDLLFLSLVFYVKFIHLSASCFWKKFNLNHHFVNCIQMFQKIHENVFKDVITQIA